MNCSPFLLAGAYSKNKTKIIKYEVSADCPAAADWTEGMRLTAGNYVHHDKTPTEKLRYEAMPSQLNCGSCGESREVIIS